MTKFISPNSREPIGAYDPIAKEFFYLEGTSITGALNVNATISGSVLPISGATTAVSVAIVDSSGNQISSFGGGSQYVEGVTTTPATGTAILGRYLTTPTLLTDGQLFAPLLDTSGRLDVYNGSLVNIATTVGAISGAIPSGAIMAGVYSVSGTVGYLQTGNTGGLLTDGSSVTQPVSGTVTTTGTLVPFAYDYVAYTNTNTTTDTYQYYSGGSGGTLVATVTIVYVDSSKQQVSTVTRT